LDENDTAMPIAELIHRTTSEFSTGLADRLVCCRSAVADGGGGAVVQLTH